MKTFSKDPGNENKKEIVCAVCGSSHRKAVWKLSSFTFYRCTDCGLYYQYPQPVQKDLTTRYDDEYFSYELENEGIFFQLMLKTLKDISFDRYSAHLLKQKDPGFLDVGCATGMLLEHIRTFGWNVYGVEVCPSSAVYGRKTRKVDIFNGTLEDASYPDEMFSVVHSSHLIEHLTDPAGFIKEVYRILKPGGLFITTTPNASGLQAVINGKRWRSVIADHMYLFSLGTLRTLIEQNGFSLFAWKTWGGIPRGAAPEMIKRGADKLAKKFGFGDVMVLAARKPEE